MAPALNSICSMSVVFPAAAGPVTAILRMSAVVYPSMAKLPRRRNDVADFAAFRSTQL